VEKKKIPRRKMEGKVAFVMVGSGTKLKRRTTEGTPYI